MAAAQKIAKPRTPLAIPTSESVERSMPSYVPSQAILIHVAEPTGTSYQRSSIGSAMLTLHPILKGAGAPQIGPGTIMGVEDGRRIARTLLQSDEAKNDTSRVGVLPANLLTLEHNAITWFVPSARRRMFALDGGGNRHSLDIRWPNLVFRVVHRTLYVVAVDGSQRPDDSSAIYAAPLANVFQLGDVCLGSARLPRGRGLDTLNGWERVIFDTNFSHVNHSATLRGGATSEELLAFWQGRVGKRTPPARSLLHPMKTTLGQWLNATAKEST